MKGKGRRVLERILFWAPAPLTIALFVAAGVTGNWIWLIGAAAIPGLVMLVSSTSVRLARKRSPRSSRLARAVI